MMTRGEGERPLKDCNILSDKIMSLLYKIPHKRWKHDTLAKEDSFHDFLSDFDKSYNVLAEVYSQSCNLVKGHLGSTNQTTQNKSN